MFPSGKLHPNQCLPDGPSGKASLRLFPAKTSPPVAASASATAALTSGASVSSIASPKRHSFGKSTPPPKPKPPTNVATKSADEKLKRADEKRASVKSVDSVVKKTSLENVERPSVPEVFEPVTTAKSGADNNDLDSVQRGDKLVHPTADRVRAPKRRPPSSLFVKEAVS